MTFKYSQDFSYALIFSREEAMRLHNRHVTTEHLLLAILRNNTCEAAKLLEKLCDNLHEVRDAIEKVLLTDDPYQGPLENLTIDEDAALLLKNCADEARQRHDSIINTIHLLLAILKKTDSNASLILQSKGIDYEKISLMLTPEKKDVNSSFEFDDEEDEPMEDPRFRDERKEISNRVETPTENRKGDTPYLDKFGTDMTQKAASGKLDPVYGREKEIERIAQILSRKKKNNPILIGEPGVGKTAIVEGLAQRITSQQVPISLFDKRVVALDLPALVAGTKYRGQFEERIQNVLSELKSHPEVILFIDEIHTMVGAGSAAGSMDAANMLKPALARGEVQCIGSTTTDEYRKTIEKDGALERRFQKIMVEPTSPEETLRILHNIKAAYEQHHRVKYSDEALEACVRLTDRYVTDRQLPDKAIDALDEAGSRMHLVSADIPDNLREAELQAAALKKEKQQAVDVQDFEKAAELRNREVDLQREINQLKEEWERKLRSDCEKVDLAAVEETVSMMSGVPVHKLKGKESVRLKGLRQNLLQQVIAQDKAVDKLVRTITRNRMGLSDPNKPIGTFLFLGPTGVGKTYLAKVLAEYMFGSADALIRIDMSEFMEKFSTSRLVGAPPGYVGYDEGGQLTEKVKRHPYSIVLLDEIEKANKDVFNLLLQVMDEGRLTDSNGSTVDFKNTVIILTSNVGSKQVEEFGQGIGFTSETIENSRATAHESIIQKALHKQFTPEFLNRLDEIVIFEQLQREAVGRIADIELEKVRERLRGLGYEMRLEKDARRYIIDHGYDEKYGARPLKRAIQTYLEDGLSEFLMSGKARKSKPIRISLNEKEELQFQ